MKARIGLLVVLLLLIALVFGCGKEGGDKKASKTTKPTNKEKVNVTRKAESWKKVAEAHLPDVVATSCIVFSGSIVRLYFSEDGYIQYIEGKNGVNFGEKTKTNIGSDNVKESEDNPINPCILKLRSSRYLLLYSTGLNGGKFEGHGASTKLHLAYSDDGRTFAEKGVVAELEKDQSAVVNDVDAVLLEDGTIRLFGTDNGISTAISKDGGRTWITDGFNVIPGGGNDPDVHLRPDRSFVLYYSVSARRIVRGKSRHKLQEKDQEASNIRMAVSEDGIAWKKTAGFVLSPGDANLQVFNPDYAQLSNKAEIMYFNEARTAKARAEGSIRLQEVMRRLNE